MILFNPYNPQGFTRKTLLVLPTDGWKSAPECQKVTGFGQVRSVRLCVLSFFHWFAWFLKKRFGCHQPILFTEAIRDRVKSILRKCGPTEIFLAGRNPTEDNLAGQLYTGGPIRITTGIDWPTGKSKAIAKSSVSIKDSRNIWSSRVLQNTDFSTDFHVFGVEWTPTGFRFFIDNDLIGEMRPPAGGFWELGGFEGENIWSNGTRMAPFDHPVLIGVLVFLFQKIF